MKTVAELRKENDQPIPVASAPGGLMTQEDCMAGAVPPAVKCTDCGGILAASPSLQVNDEGDVFCDHCAKQHD